MPRGHGFLVKEATGRRPRTALHGGVPTMKTIPRRTAIGAGCATIAMILTKTEAVVADPRLEDIQALLSDLRNCDPGIMVAVYVAFQEVADRLETLPGVVPVLNEQWREWKPRLIEERATARWPIGPYLTTRGA